MSTHDAPLPPDLEAIIAAKHADYFEPGLGGWFIDAMRDLARAALRAGRTPLSPDAAQVVRRFEQTTDEGRRALLALADALPDATPAGARKH
jgi:hypothetical protein